MPENVRLIFSGSEELKSGTVDDTGLPVVRFANLPPDCQKQLIEHLFE
jgi:hypothetical protein